MYFKQFYLGCLAHASYLVGSRGEAAVVDPRRDVDEYLDEARAQGLAIKYVVETHLHADFVSGHRELAARTGAEIVFGHRAGVAFAHRAVRDGDELRVGEVTLRFLETPGHTPEGVSVLVYDGPATGAPRLVLTGDTLFIGDVGRPDLVGTKGFTAAEMASQLYDSLHGKLLKLPDEVAVYPAHGAGSLCGRHMSQETSSTIGEQRRSNHALQPMSRAEFVEMATRDLPEVPAYFARDVEMNRAGAAPVPERALPAALAPGEFAARATAGAPVLDVRSAAAFGTAHVPGSHNIGLNGQFASWAGTLLAPAGGLLLVADGEDEVREAALRLARVGVENVTGFLEGGIAAWDRAGQALASLPQITVTDLHQRLGEDAELQVLDVRRPGEYAAGHLPRAVNLPLDRVPHDRIPLDPGKPAAVVCAGGYRSSAAASVLLRRGFADLLNVVGGTAAWIKAGYETEAEPSAAI
jgi:glyoxylase-like metal-dependent hydrolase (beta-lactamase superfamily II)/rhodanese-related sulfurtransferase